MESTQTKEIDIRKDVCPMTTVRVRLALDRLAPGSCLGIKLAGEEPHRNVASAIRMLGHTILEDNAWDEGDANYYLLVRKSDDNTKASDPSA